jgi:hypothetical protein
MGPTATVAIDLDVHVSTIVPSYTYVELLGSFITLLPSALLSTVLIEKALVV